MRILIAITASILLIKSSIMADEILFMTASKGIAGVETYLLKYNVNTKTLEKEINYGPFVNGLPGLGTIQDISNSELMVCTKSCDRVGYDLITKEILVPEANVNGILNKSILRSTDGTIFHSVFANGLENYSASTFSYIGGTSYITDNDRASFFDIHSNKAIVAVEISSDDVKTYDLYLQSAGETTAAKISSAPVDSVAGFHRNPTSGKLTYELKLAEGGKTTAFEIDPTTSTTDSYSIPFAQSGIKRLATAPDGNSMYVLVSNDIYAFGRKEQKSYKILNVGDYSITSIIPVSDDNDNGSPCTEFSTFKTDLMAVLKAGLKGLSTAKSLGCTIDAKTTKEIKSVNKNLKTDFSGSTNGYQLLIYSDTLSALKKASGTANKCLKSKGKPAIGGIKKLGNLLKLIKANGAATFGCEL